MSPLSNLNAIQTPAPGVRGFISSHPIVVGTSAVLIVLGCLLYSFKKHTPRVLAYYTIDDGSTFFAAPVQAPPFSVSGQEAVGAMVYSCDGVKPTFVGYLYRYTPEGKALAEQKLKDHRFGPPSGMEIKRPGAGTWILATSQGPQLAGSSEDAASITDVKCPDGAVPYIMSPP